MRHARIMAASAHPGASDPALRSLAVLRRATGVEGLRVRTRASAWWITCHRTRRSGRLAAAMADAVSSLKVPVQRLRSRPGLILRADWCAVAACSPPHAAKLTLALAASLALHLLIGAGSRRRATRG